MNNGIQFLLYCCSGIFINILCILFWHNLLELNVNWRDKKNYFLIVIMTILSVLLNLYCPQPFKFVMSFIILIIVAFSISKKLTSSIIMVILLEFCLLIIEVIFVIITCFFITNYEDSLVVTISNIFVLLIGLLVIKTKIPRKIFLKISNSVKSVALNEFVVYSVGIISIITISTMEAYMKLPLTIVLITNIVMTIIITSVVFKYVSTKNKYYLISNKYQTSISSLKEYELMINKFRIYNHENKNELLTIRNISKDKKVIKYIDNLVDNKNKDYGKIMNITAKIPQGGLRATIYSKLCLMEKYNIDYILDVSKDVSLIDLINIDDSHLVNVCRILGVFLDNAIEEVKGLDERNIEIELYIIDSSLYIDITNNYCGSLDLDSMLNTKYSTKGKNHGYGLLLVKNILKESNGLLENDQIVNGDMFTQSLRIALDSN